MECTQAFQSAGIRVYAIMHGAPQVYDVAIIPISQRFQPGNLGE
jgi:hypothetical protein